MKCKNCAEECGPSGFCSDECEETWDGIEAFDVDDFDDDQLIFED